MSNQTMHAVLIKRTWTSVFQNYFRMKNMNGKVVRMCTKRDHEILEPYEKLFNRPLGRMDAIVVSPLTKSEVYDIINNYDTNYELHAYRDEMNEKRLKEYYKDHGYEE